MRLPAPITGPTTLVELTKKKPHFAEKCVPRCATKRNCTSQRTAGDYAMSLADAVSEWESERVREWGGRPGVIAYYCATVSLPAILIDVWRRWSTSYQLQYQHLFRFASVVKMDIFLLFFFLDKINFTTKKIVDNYVVCRSSILHR